MPYIVCAEEVERHWVAYAPDLPGCFATQKDPQAAISAIPAAVEAYLAWAAGHGLHISGLSAPLVVDEVIRVWSYDEGYEVNAFFASDRPPLLPDEIPEIELLLTATREDLQAAVQDLAEDALSREFPGERWPIRNDIDHGSVDAEDPAELIRIETRFLVLWRIVLRMFSHLIPFSPPSEPSSEGHMSEFQDSGPNSPA
jgi:predicted RNase H-like HicB family nuclease